MLNGIDISMIKGKWLVWKIWFMHIYNMARMYDMVYIDKIWLSDMIWIKCVYIYIIWLIKIMCFTNTISSL